MSSSESGAESCEEEHDGMDTCMVEASMVSADAHRNEMNTAKRHFIHDSSIAQLCDNDVVCFYDCHTFNTEAYGIPLKFCIVDGTYTFTTYGRFCSLECARSYISEQGGASSSRKMELLAMMGRKMYGRDTRIDKAPPRSTLRLFGGPLDIETYRRSLGTSDLWVVRDVCQVRTHLVFDHYVKHDKSGGMTKGEKLMGNENAKKTGAIGRQRQQVTRDTTAHDIPLKRRSVPAYVTKSSLDKMLRVGKKT